MSDFTPAKRGDLVATKAVRRSSSLYAGSGLYESVHLGIVTSVTRDGGVKSVETLPARGRLTPRDWDSVLIVPARLGVDLERVKADCPDYFPSMDDIRAFLKERATAAA